MGLFKTYSQKEVKRLRPTVEKINSLEPEIQKLTDEQLRHKTVSRIVAMSLCEPRSWL